jgi:Dynamin central region
MQSNLRSSGVLTKPDTLPPTSTNARSMWLDVLEGRSHPLKHGYFCTKQPDDVDLEAGITTAEARAAEADYFAHNAPWSNSLQRHRLGIDNLIKMLSTLLIQVITER